MIQYVKRNSCALSEVESVEKKLSVITVLCVVAYIMASWVGIGYRSSASAIADLRAELEVLHGEEYVRKTVGTEEETMQFAVKPKTFLLTNYNLRNALGLDYEYECIVTVTAYEGGKENGVRTVTYRGFDPMGKDRMDDRAYVDVSSKQEMIEKQ